MARTRRTRRRRWLLVTLVLLFFGAAAGGAYYVFKVARTRTSPYEQAYDLREAGDDKAAAAKLRSILEANQDDARSRLMLIDILADDNRVEDAEKLARYWLEIPETESLGLRTLSQLALRRADIAAALGFARMVADREPAFSQMMNVRVHDAIGSPGSREQSARASETLAGLVTSPEAKAEAWLYAAETLRDIERMLTDGPLKQSLVQRSALDREKARAALRESAYWKQRYPEGKALMARIDLLADKEKKQDTAVDVLLEFLESKPKSHGSRMSLIRHLIGTADYGKAGDHIRLLRDAPALLYLRALSAMAAAGERALVLTLIEEGEESQKPMLALIRARVLINGEGAEREEGMLAFEKMALDRKDDAMVVRESFLRIKAAGDTDRALRLLDRTGSEDTQLRFGVLLDRAVAAIETGDSAEGDAELATLAEALEGPNLSVALTRLRQAKGVEDAVLLRLMDKAVAAGKAEANQVRLLRAILRLSRPGEAEEREAARLLALGDLEAIAGDPDARRAPLLSAASLAQAAAAPELVGRLAGRALLADDEEQGDPIALYLAACATRDEAIRTQAATGLESAAMPGREAWIRKLAGALAAGDATKLRVPSSGWKPTGQAPQPLGARLQLTLAVRALDWPEAEAYARKLLAAWPTKPGGKERLASIFFAAKKYEDILALYEGGELELTQRMHRIDALHALERSEEALAEARSLAHDTNGSDQALMILAVLQKDSAPDGALAAVSQISPRASATLRLRAELLRGELLEKKGDMDFAGQIYADLLKATGRKNLFIWRRLARVRSAQKRDGEFIRRISAAIEAPPQGMRLVDVPQLSMIRGQSREKIHDYERALEDYRTVILALPNDVGALNNAAWIMHAHIRWGSRERTQRLEEALAFSTRAAETAPNVAPVFHTRAKIFDTLGRKKAALADFDHAIELFTEVLDAAPDQSGMQPLRLRRARYRLDKADLLKSMDRTKEARAIYSEVRDAHEGTSEGRKAQVALKDM